VRLCGWALVLGASSGFGEASSIALARAGLDIFGVHLDRKATLTNVERIVATIEGLGRQARFFNVNAADADRRAEVLEEMTRAMELASRRITVNAIRAGVTPTPAAQKIPGYDTLVDQARRRNPSGRLTTPEDVARALVVLAHPDTAWITGNVIGVDGGEDVVG